MKSILVVEDEPEINELIRDNLSDLGLKIDHALNATEGFQLCVKKKYELILSDVRMPKMTGREMFASIRRNENPNQKTTFIFISAFLDEVKDLFDSETVFLIRKPIEFDYLKTLVKQLLKIP